MSKHRKTAPPSARQYLAAGVTGSAMVGIGVDPVLLVAPGKAPETQASPHPVFRERPAWPTCRRCAGPNPPLGRPGRRGWGTTPRPPGKTWTPRSALRQPPAPDNQPRAGARQWSARSPRHLTPRRAWPPWCYQRREAACRIGWCLVAPARDVEGSPESERTGIVRLATKYFNTVFSRMPPRPLRGIGPANSVVELEVLGLVMRSRPRTGSGYTDHTAGLRAGDRRLKL